MSFRGEARFLAVRHQRQKEHEALSEEFGEPIASAIRRKRQALAAFKRADRHCELARCTYDRAVAALEGARRELREADDALDELLEGSGL